MKIKELSRLTAKIKTRTICGFDCETYGQKNDYYMNTFTYNDKDFSFWNREEFIEWMIHKKDIQSNCMIFASNLMFDFFCIFNTTDLQKNFRMLFRNGKLLKAYCYIHHGEMINPKVAKFNQKKRKLEFFDTLNFFPVGVETLGESINFPKMKKPNFIGDIPKNKIEKDYLEKYCLRDSKISCKFMEFLQENLNYMGGNLKITIPSSAMDLFRRKFLMESLRTPDIEKIKLMYKAYYGGRTEAFKRGLCHDVNVYDINSLYPYCMKNAVFPHPNYLEHSFINIKDIESYEGITEAIVDVPYSHIPYLPMRDKKLLFGHGHFKGWFTFYELRKAMNQGVYVKFFGKQIATENLFNPFAGYVDTLWNLRAKWKSELNPSEIVAKLFSNVLYGKFGEKILDRTDVEFLENMTREKMKANWKLGYSMEIIDDIMIIKKPIDKFYSAHVNPMLASYVTAYARNELFNLLNKSPENTYYCDTDSLFTTKKLETSTDLGGLKLEYKFKDVVIVRPKFYSGITDAGKEIVKIKGLHNITSTKQFNDLMKTTKYTSTRYMKFFESKRRKFLKDSLGNEQPYDFTINEKIDIPKKLSFTDNKREWAKPFNIVELQESIPRLIQI